MKQFVEQAFNIPKDAIGRYPTDSGTMELGAEIMQPSGILARYRLNNSNTKFRIEQSQGIERGIRSAKLARETSREYFEDQIWVKEGDLNVRRLDRYRKDSPTQTFVSATLYTPKVGYAADYDRLGDLEAVFSSVAESDEYQIYTDFRMEASLRSDADNLKEIASVININGMSGLFSMGGEYIDVERSLLEADVEEKTIGWSTADVVSTKQFLTETIQALAKKSDQPISNDTTDILVQLAIKELSDEYMISSEDDQFIQRRVAIAESLMLKIAEYNARINTIAPFEASFIIPSTQRVPLLTIKERFEEDTLMQVPEWKVDQEYKIDSAGFTMTKGKQRWELSTRLGTHQTSFSAPGSIDISAMSENLMSPDPQDWQKVSRLFQYKD